MNDRRFGSGSKWFLALSHLATDQKTEAEIIFNEFIENETPKYAKGAKVVLEDLDNFWRF